MQTRAETWTDGNGFTWSFTVNGTEATDIKPAMFETHYIYGDPANPEQGPVTLGLADAAAGRFSSTEGKYFPTIPGDVYFGLKTLIFDIIDAQEGSSIWGDETGCTMRVMNGWWSAVYADDVPMSVGSWELPITEQMARECASSDDGGQGRDLDLLMTRGSITIKSVYYQDLSFSETVVVIPEKVYVGSTELTVTSIGNRAFKSCSNMESVTIPEGVTSIGESAFAGCTSLTSVTIPEGVTSIGMNAFALCKGLTSVTIPSSVASIGVHSFYGCSGLTSVTIPEGVMTIGEEAFESCSSLTSVTIPSSVTSIGSSAFSLCFNLTSVTISEGVQSIGSYAFSTCYNLTSVTIPSSVTSIGEKAFFYCYGLTSVTSLIEEPFEISSNVFENRNNETGQYDFTTATLYVPAGTKEKYLATPAWNQFQNIVEMEDKNIQFADAAVKAICVENWDTDGDGELSYAEAAAVTRLGQVFQLNTEITSFDELQYFTGLTSIGDEAFSACSGLTSVTIPESVTSIGIEAFHGCSGLMSVTIPSSVTSIGEYAFEFCKGLTSLTIPSSVTSIDESAFRTCTGLTSITVEEGNSSYDSRNNCNAIIETATNTLIQGCPNTVIPDGVVSIGNYAFEGFSSMTSVTIPSSVTSIGCEAFDGCSGLTSITIPEGVTSIDNDAFYNCSGLTSVAIPSSVTSIGESVFFGCTSLISVTSLIAEPFEIDSDVFRMWNEETGQYEFTSATLYVPAGTKEKYEATPAWNLFQDIVEMDSPSGILINSTTFPDDNFRNWVLAQDYGQDGVLTETEIANVWGIDVSFNNIADLKGIEHFTKIRSLVCYGNLLTSLDISQNTALWSLLCTGNQLTSLDLSKNTELSKLECTGNLLTSLDFSKNTALTQLFCSNNQIDETEMGKLVESLPTPIYDGYFFVKLLDNSAEHNVITTAQVAAARAKGWTVYAYDENWNAVEYDGDEHRELDPINNGEAVDFGTDISEDTNIDGNTVGDIYYSISSGDGSYDPSEGCIVVTSPTDDETVSGVSGTDIFGEDFNAHFTGVVFKVAPGKGTIRVEAQTTGNMVLKVKIGDGEPITMELEGKLKVSFPYNVGEETYVYIYGSENSAAANGMRFAPSTGSLKIYGIEVESVTDGIETATLADDDDDAPIYNLNGQRVNTPHRGVYIQNGKKVLVK